MIPHVPLTVTISIRSSVMRLHAEISKMLFSQVSIHYVQLPYAKTVNKMAD